MTLFKIYTDIHVYTVQITYQEYGLVLPLELKKEDLPKKYSVHSILVPEPTASKRRSIDDLCLTIYTRGELASD